MAGASVLTGVDTDRVLAAAAGFLDPDEQRRVAAIACPYGDGTTGRQVADLLDDPEVHALLHLEEPDYTDGTLPPGVGT